eukprot:TRINITY_DN812_c0_g1_i2.p1 TRINITY_DN812_c0_g1~~TRINITY_DN812_c0_g1_i2.p1  ORF type:complete len:188 (-),score=24.16 TRINITY_DN812_c0_g1_i2:679-1242(-)
MMKQLWQHLCLCKVQTCGVLHCVSFRFVLGHYHRCKNTSCPVCKPVRACIQKARADAANRERLERQRKITMHMQLLAHAVECVNPDCPSTNCRRIKALMSHLQTCPSSAQGVECDVCKRVRELVSIHARQCDEQGCKVPGCDAMRQQMRAATKQQEEKDARRRQLMKSWYRERAQRARSAPKSNGAL